MGGLFSGGGGREGGRERVRADILTGGGGGYDGLGNGTGLSTGRRGQHGNQSSPRIRGRGTSGGEGGLDRELIGFVLPFLFLLCGFFLDGFLLSFFLLFFFYIFFFFHFFFFLPNILCLLLFLFCFRFRFRLSPPVFCSEYPANCLCSVLWEFRSKDQGKLFPLC